MKSKSKSANTVAKKPAKAPVSPASKATSKKMAPKKVASKAPAKAKTPAHKKPAAAVAQATNVPAEVSTLASMVANDLIPRKSSMKSPCQVVWEVASSMPADSARKDVLAACMAKGIAFYTARTQYQQWKHAGNNDKAAAAKSAALLAKVAK